MSDSPKGVFGVQLFDKIWSSILKKQESINRQLEESERKILRQMEENRRLTELSEEKFFRQQENKHKQLEMIDQRIKRQLKENRLKEEEIEDEITDEVTVKKGKRSKKFKLKHLEGAENTDRYGEYNKIFEDIVNAQISNEEKQELVETITKIYQKFASG